eukprot:COSAG05_NODE_3378_length_2100_cov_3.102319_1_plen_20_part_10
MAGCEHVACFRLTGWRAWVE